MHLKELCHSDIMALLPDRAPNSHKGDYGKVLLLCGSIGYTGAAALAAQAATRVGAGLVYLAVPQSIYLIEAIKLTEQIVYPLPECNGTFSTDAGNVLKKYLCDKDALLVGPGIGRSEGAMAVTRYVLENFAGPVVLDADGINCISSHKDILRGRTGNTIITSHEGEFSRITGKPIGDRVNDAKQLAGELGVIVVLKGHRTVITDGDVVYLNPTGNPGLAVGGSGDVLAGVITGLLGQGLPVLEAAAAGVWLHGAAGDICAQEIGQYGMIPSDVINVLPRLMK